MASTYLNNGTTHPHLVIAHFLFLLLVSLSLDTNSLSFNFTSFNPNNPLVNLQGDATISGNNEIQLTRNAINGPVTGSSGRALYPTAMQLWDASTKLMTSFSTNFTFSITQANSTYYGDGLTFLLVPNNTRIPNDSNGGCLGLFSDGNKACVLNQTIVAVEFDTFQNDFDPSPNHIGIDVNSIVSNITVNVSIGLINKTAKAFVSYDSTTKNLSVSLDVEPTSPPYSVPLSYIIDLSTILPKKVQVGFSASTGLSVEVHNILDWSFNSSLEEGGTQGKPSTSKGGLVGGIAVGLFLILMIGIANVWIRVRKSRREAQEGTIEATQIYISEDFDEEAGPKRFAYSELSRATNNFAIEGKLGEGGFGGVYKGLVMSLVRKEIAVKKIKSGSNQGKKEYISEVKVISRLRHRNLVQLLGWCHDHGELLLVYEFMPNRILDYHLFGKRLAFLPWEIRYKIALGLASAVLYLHEEGEQSVVHRDIKCSNVMLDLSFNPKLGDFGLARFADHDVGLQTTVPGGTPGYLAPECLLTGRASKESDVYSFGIVALEIACGRKVIEAREEASKVKLVEWVWDLYGKGFILEAIDERIEGEFDEQQAICLMIVGLWCSHPDVSYRPSIKQAIATLNFETPLPSLPLQLPIPIYVSPSMNKSLFPSYSPSNTIEENYQHTSSTSINTSIATSSLQSEKSTSNTYPLMGSQTMSE